MVTQENKKEINRMNILIIILVVMIIVTFNKSMKLFNKGDK